MTDLDKLIEAVEAGTAPKYSFLGEARYPSLWSKSLGKNMGDAAAAYSGSLDAAKRLHDALLPGWDWSVCNVAPDRGAADIGNGVGKLISTVAATPARAWLLAILRAVKAKG